MLHDSPTGPPTSAGTCRATYPLMRTVTAFFAALVATLAALPVLILASPFIAIGTLTRVLARLMEPAHLTLDQLTEYDPVYGWKPRPNLDTHHLMVDLFHIRTDSQGWRGKWKLAESDVVVFGDSFAAGYGIGEREFFANLPAGPRIKPIGIGGYSLVQELLWMRHMAADLRGKLVVWFIYFGNDLLDNISPDLRGYRKPFLRTTDGGRWEIFSGHVSPEKWPLVTKRRLEGAHHLPTLAELCCPTFISERAYDACRFLIREGQRVCADAGAQLVVMTVPDALQLSPAGCQELLSMGGNPKTFDPAYPDRQIETICRELGVTFVEGKSFLDPGCYKTDDCHWNARGHHKIAEAISDLYAKRQEYEVPVRSSPIQNSV
jgi:hypothetical protein